MTHRPDPSSAWSPDTLPYFWEGGRKNDFRKKKIDLKKKLKKIAPSKKQKKTRARGRGSEACLTSKDSPVAIPVAP